MKENQKTEKDSKNQKESPSDTKNGPNHGHDYSKPIAGEDGGTEDQSGNYGKKTIKDSNENQHSKQGKTVNENSTI